MEIERKYLVRTDAWRALATGSSPLWQGYLTDSSGIDASITPYFGHHAVTVRYVGVGQLSTSIILPLTPEGLARLARHVDDQGQVRIGEGFEARVRIAPDGAVATLKSLDDLARTEVEGQIDLRSAQALRHDRANEIDTFVGTVEKVRSTVPLDGQLRAEVDEFSGANAGLVTVEVELPSTDHAFAKPGWFGKEITSDARYKNRNLALQPYSSWSQGTGLHP